MLNLVDTYSSLTRDCLNRPYTARPFLAGCDIVNASDKHRIANRCFLHFDRFRFMMTDHPRAEHRLTLFNVVLFVHNRFCGECTAQDPLVVFSAMLNAT